MFVYNIPISGSLIICSDEELSEYGVNCAGLKIIKVLSEEENLFDLHSQGVDDIVDIDQYVPSAPVLSAELRAVSMGRAELVNKTRGKVNGE